MDGQVRNRRGAPNLVPCTVESVRVHVLTGQHVVLLQAKDSNRLLPIWIGPDQAHSIATRIAGIASERPLTHDLMMDMLAPGTKREVQEEPELPDVPLMSAAPVLPPPQADSTNVPRAASDRPKRLTRMNSTSITSRPLLPLGPPF